jgi:NAD(P) transhydrogenase subunit alpha
MLRVFIPKESGSDETRVAATPESVRHLVREGVEVTVEAGAGVGAHIADSGYEAAGARLGSDPAALWSTADAVLKVGPLGPNDALGGPEVDTLKKGATVIGLLAPHDHPDTLRRLAEREITAFAMELIPRISRAQSMDALSSQANIAGYLAVLLAASRLDKFFPLLMTAAGTVSPARVVIMGAGVAGLQAVATAKRLGAVVEVSDIRLAVKEQVESLGGKFIALPMEESGEGEGGYAREMGEEFLRQQRAIVKARLTVADAAITTALVPGKPAPRLITADMVEAMRDGSVIVDLASQQGGNCELSQTDQEVVHNGVMIVAPSNLATSLPLDASALYARNILTFFLHLIKEGQLALDLEDEIVAGSLLTHQGRIVHPAFSAPELEGVRS